MNSFDRTVKQTIGTTDYPKTECCGAKIGAMTNHLSHCPTIKAVAGRKNNGRYAKRSAK